MAYDPNLHHRRSIRLPDYDYSETGGYFITICARNQDLLFGEIVDGEITLNEYGTIVEQCWNDLPNHYSNIELDTFIIMPDHVHGIIIINESKETVGTAGSSGTGRVRDHAPTTTKIHGLSEIVRAFKSYSAKRINQLRNATGQPFWQRNYYEHVIRNEADMERIRQYIHDNPYKTED